SFFVLSWTRGCSSAGRVPALQAAGTKRASLSVRWGSRAPKGEALRNGAPAFGEVGDLWVVVDGQDQRPVPLGHRAQHYPVASEGDVVGTQAVHRLERRSSSHAASIAGWAGARAMT